MSVDSVRGFDLHRGSRLAITGIVVASLFLALFSRLFFLQVVDGHELAAAAKANQVRTVYEDAPRGRILDRTGKVLAASREVDAVTVDRTALQKDPTLLARLAPVLQTTEDALRKRLNDSRNSSFGPAIVASGLDKGIAATFRERQSEFSGADAKTVVERWYPSGQLAAHVLGYVGEINETELASHRSQGYRMSEDIGKSGVESAYERYLRGVPGMSKIEVDSSGRAVRVLEHKAPIPGDDVELSIDSDVQRAAEDGLDEATNAVHVRTNSTDSARGGSVVAVDPRNGNIVAMASSPTYDPSLFTSGISQTDYQKLSDPSGSHPLNNRAIQGTYAPGSTFKLATAIASLEKGVISPTTVVNDGGAYILGGRRFQNSQNIAHGPVDLVSAITVSSDVYFYGLGDKLWATRKSNGDAIQEAARNLGMGRTQQFPIPGEAAGRIPDPDNRRKQHDEQPNVFPEGNWYAGDNVNLAIGQGDTLVTPLQLADAYGAFSMGGTLRAPQIVSRITDPNGKVVYQQQSKVLSSNAIPENVKNPIEKGLTGVVSNPKGTAYGAFKGFDTKGFPVAGKTGTAQVNGKGDTALFAGYGPVGNPQLAFSVVLEQGGFGSESAAPVARKVLGVVAGQGTAPVELQAAVD